MKTVSIRELRHDTQAILEWVEAGEQVEIQRRGRPVAVLSQPAAPAAKTKRPDFAGRLRAIYGENLLPVTATELLNEERGQR